MSDSNCKFVWYELMTTDVEAAEAFYKAVVGWDTRDSGMPGIKYTLFTVGETGVAGMMKLPSEECEKAQHPFWMGYIAVEDTDAYAGHIKAAGGQIMREPEDIPGVGRFAVAADPHGAVFLIMKPQGEAPADYPAPETAGLVGWRELHAGNGPEAFAFYSELFGWKKAHAMDMGEHGVYQIFSIDGADSGAMMTKMPDTPSPFWLYYFNVPNLSSAIEQVKSNGGQVIMGPHEVPGPMWIVQCLDPQGAIFALVAPVA